MSNIYRKSTPRDFETILEMCGVFWTKTQFTEEFDPEHTLDMVELSYDCDMLIVAEEDGEVIGFMAGFKAPLLGSREAFMVTELAWWINPQNRGKLHGIELVKLLESLCIEQDVKYLNLAFMETSMPVKVKQLYENLGYTLQETIFTKVLNGSNNSVSCGSSRSRPK